MRSPLLKQTKIILLKTKNFLQSIARYRRGGYIPKARPSDCSETVLRRSSPHLAIGHPTLRCPKRGLVGLDFGSLWNNFVSDRPTT